MIQAGNQIAEIEGRHDGSLITRLQGGDEEAFAAIYDFYSRTIYGVILRIVRNQPLAEDLLQEVFLKLWRSSATLDGSAVSLGPWLAAVARHQVLDYFKSGYNQRAIKS